MRRFPVPRPMPRHPPTRRRPSGALPFLAAVAVLALAGCGGRPAAAPGITGAGGAPVRTSPAKELAGPADGPRMRFPADVRLDFAAAPSSDPRARAAYAGAANFVRAISLGIVEQDSRQEAHLFYSEFGSPAQGYAQEQIVASVGQGFTLTGIQRYSVPEVSVADSGRSATVTFCGDDSRVFSKVVRTGKVLRTEESAASHHLWHLGMVVADETPGLWRAREIHVEGSVARCRRV